MGVMELLARTDKVSMSSGTYGQIRMIADARTEAALYRAGIPEKYFNTLVHQLRGVSRTALNSALLLYDGLLEDPKLPEELRVQLIPQLARLVREHGSIVHVDDRYVDGLLKTVSSPNGETGQTEPRLVAGITREPKTTDEIFSRLPYGSYRVRIAYGKREESFAGKIHKRGKVQTSTYREPSAPMVRKAEKLVAYISTGEWIHAAEAFMDLLRFPGHLFHYRSTYVQFLHEVGSILKKRSPEYGVRFIYHEELGFPMGYAVTNPNRAAERKQTKSNSGLDSVVSSARIPEEVNGVWRRHHQERRIHNGVHFDSLKNNQKILIQPPPTLEKSVARFLRGM